MGEYNYHQEARLQDERIKHALMAYGGDLERAEKPKKKPK